MLEIKLTTSLNGVPITNAEMKKHIFLNKTVSNVIKDINGRINIIQHK